jgi:hypothetical protein
MNIDALDSRKRFLFIAMLLFVVVVLTAVAWTSVSASHWVGRKELQVVVLVADADTAKPLSGVPITVFAGPWGPVEYSLSDVTKATLNLDSESAEVQRFATGEDGRIEFTRPFFAAGTDIAFRHSGYVRTAGTWIEAAPPGYGVVLLPLDGQSVHPRDINIDTPIYVTILVRKPKDITRR